VAFTLKVEELSKQGKNLLEIRPKAEPPLTLKMEATCSSVTPVDFQRTARRYTRGAEKSLAL
jgi:hypothetical protein